MVYKPLMRPAISGGVRGPGGVGWLAISTVVDAFRISYNKPVDTVDIPSIGR